MLVTKMIDVSFSILRNVVITQGLVENLVQRLGITAVLEYFVDKIASIIQEVSIIGTFTKDDIMVVQFQKMILFNY